VLEAGLEGYRAFQTRDPLYVEQAFNLIAQARRLAPADAQTLVSWFGVAMNTGRFDEAEKALHEIELLLPGDVRTLQRRALLREHQGDRRQALELLRTAVRRHPSAGFLTDLANMEMRQGEIPAARATMEELVRRVPEDRAGQNVLAGLELKAGNLERANALYARMASSRPSFGVLSNLAFAQLLLGRYGEAAANYRAAYALAPTSYSASLNLGDAELLRGQPAAARALYRQALAQVAQDPGRDAPPALVAAAQAEAHLGRGPEAAAIIERAVVAAPNDPEIAFYAALVYALIGETASATASAGRCLAGGISAGWFSLPWFDELRKSPEFLRLLGKASAAPAPR
jgi:tetratricopeptide (TPR) repeat protein